MGSLFKKLTESLTGNVGDTVKEIASIWKVPADVVLANESKITELKTNLAIKTLDSANVEIQAAAEVIKAEAQSQSWLPRNVRPLCLLFWAAAITLNALMGMYAHYFQDASITPFALDDWLYKLTAIGFTGYVTARTWEKYKDKDN
jgi:hypothetical protein